MKFQKRFKFFTICSTPCYQISQFQICVNSCERYVNYFVIGSFWYWRFYLCMNDNILQRACLKFSMVGSWKTFFRFH